MFALVFLSLCLINSAAPLLPVYAPIKEGLVEVSSWGLLIAIGALGLDTSFATIAALGWRYVTTMVGTTLVIFVVVTAGLMLLRLM